MEKAIKNLFTKKKFKVKDIKKVLIEQTNSGVYWNRIPTYDIFTALVTITGPAEIIQISVIDGKGTYKDLDQDGWITDRNSNVEIGEINGELKLYRTKD